MKKVLTILALAVTAIFFSACATKPACCGSPKCGVSAPCCGSCGHTH